jgi:hypothetical protein
MRASSIWLIAAVAAGCGSSTDGRAQIGQVCMISTDCTGKLVCRHGPSSTTCQQPCPPMSCLPNQIWNAVTCGCDTPSGIEGDPCGGNASPSPPSCHSGLVCQNIAGGPAGDVGGTCTPPCRADEDCQCPATCNVANGQCSGGGSPNCPVGTSFDTALCMCVSLRG